MGIKYSNNASTSLPSGINDSVTSITVADASSFPTLGVGDYCYLTFVSATELEVVKCTAIVGNVLTVIRAQESTDAEAFVTDDRVELRVTTAMLTDALAETVANAAGSAAAAATSETNAATSYDDFDDRWLGSKASDPTLNNDGDALIDGAAYFNTTNNVLMVYDLGGTTWKRTTPTTGSQTNIDLLSAADVITDMSILGTTDAVADMAILGTADVVTDMNVLATADVVTDMNTLGTADVVNDMNVLGTAGTVTAMNLLGVAGVVTDMGILGTADVVADMNTLGTADVVADLNTLGTADVVNDMNVLGTSGNVTNMNTLSGISADITAVSAKATEVGRLGTADAVADMNTLGTADIVSDLDTVAGIAANVTACADIDSNITAVATNATNVNTVATNITGVNSFGERYRVATLAPTTSLNAGDLYFDTTTNELRSYGTSWQATAPSAAVQASINIVAGDIVHSEDLGSVADALDSSGDAGDISTVADNIALITAVNTNIANVNLCGGSITDINTCADDIADISSVAGISSDINFFSERYRVESSAPATSLHAGDLYFDTTLNELKVYGASWQATSPSAANQANIDVVAGELRYYNEDLGLITEAVSSSSDVGDIATLANVSVEIGRLGTAAAVADMEEIADSAVIANMAVLGGNFSYVTTVAGSIADVNRYANEYTIQAGVPALPEEGDLWYDETNNVLKYYNGSIFAAIAAGIADVVSDTAPALGGNLDCNDKNLTECGTISGDNLQIDFGSIA